jgi:hypothetical protein
MGCASWDDLSRTQVHWGLRPPRVLAVTTSTAAKAKKAVEAVTFMVKCFV